jgi:hypothetical protein
MGIEIYYYCQNANPKKEDYIWTIDETSYSHLANVIDLYEKRTGKLIDEYGDIELPANTIAPLMSCVNEAIEKESDQSKLATLQKMAQTLNSAIKFNRGIGFYGD